MYTIGNAIGNHLLLGNFTQLRPGMELWVASGAESVISHVLMFAAGNWLHQRRKNLKQVHLWLQVNGSHLGKTAIKLEF